MNLKTLPTEALVNAFANSVAKYYQISKELTFEESLRDQDRADLDAYGVFMDIGNEICNRPLAEYRKLLSLFDHPDLLVRFHAGIQLEGHCLPESIALYRRLAAMEAPTPTDPDNAPVAAKSRLEVLGYASDGGSR